MRRTRSRELRGGWDARLRDEDGQTVAAEIERCEGLLREQWERTRPPDGLGNRDYPRWTARAIRFLRACPEPDAWLVSMWWEVNQ